jgi:anti-anti-sigma regulatory factor
MVTVMDSYTYRSFWQISKSLSLMGVKVVWVGLSPGVVCALIDLNVELDEKTILTALNLEQGLALLSD